VISAKEAKALQIERTSGKIEIACQQLEKAIRDAAVRGCNAITLESSMTVKFEYNELQELIKVLHDHGYEVSHFDDQREQVSYHTVKWC
jgi:hypothetical protein